MSPNQTMRNLLRARLLEKKGLSIDEWEKTHGYAKGVVHKIISRFIGQPKRPCGEISLSIIEALEQETGVKICG